MTPPPPDARQRHARKRLAMVLLGGVAGLAFGVAVLYGIGRMARNAAGDPACGAAVETARKVAPLIKGEVAALTAAKSGLRIPDMSFKDESGATRTLADWRGRTVLFNLWATWCAPCRQEMPALEALQKTLGSERFEVVTVNIDTRDADKPKAWLKEVGIEGLRYFADSQAVVFQELKSVGKAFGMPTTVLIDPNGCEIATLAGPAEWASPDAVAVVKAALEGAPAR